MRPGRRGLAGLLCLVGGLLGVERAPGQAGVSDVRFWSYPEYTRVVVELERLVETRVHRLPADGRADRPERLYLDLPDVWVGRDYAEGIPVGDGLLRALRLGQNTRKTARLVIDLERYERHRLLVLSAPPRLVVDIYGPRPHDPSAPRALSAGLRPVRSVVIDPGHGGRDPGAASRSGLREKDVVLRLARALRPRLEARGLVVRLTREDDRTLELEERTAFAEGVGGDVFVSLHANAAPSRRLRGVETYYLDKSHERHTVRVAAHENGISPGELDSLQRTLAGFRISELSGHSERLARSVHGEIVAGLRRRFGAVDDLGVKRGPFFVLFLSNLPSILVEVGFLTHPEEARRLGDAAYLDALADEIAEGILRYREVTPPVVAERRGLSELPRIEGLLPESVPPRGAPDGVAVAVRAYLRAAREHLAALHARERSGRLTNALCSELTDRLVRQLFALGAAASELDPAERLCVVAVGGYGREEMSIHSDVDLLFLHGEPLSTAAAALAERVQVWLWDAGLAVGCAVRTVAESTGLAREDLTVASALLDARRLAGAPELAEELAGSLGRELFGEPAAFVEAQRQLRLARHQRFGESLYLLQPNVKEGAGGLRDYHGARWALRAAHPHASAFESFERLGLLTGDELADLARALDFLWHVRNELHFLLGRRVDQMGFAQQEEIAKSLGYDAGVRAELPVERFMGDYYRHARVVASTSALVLDQCLARTRPPGPPVAALEVEDGFRVVGDHLEIPDTRQLRERPLRCLTAFEVAQRHRVPLSRTALRLVRENLDLVDDAVRRDPEAVASFFRILDAEHRVFRTLTAMNEIGVLGRFLPEWEHLVCRWQHVMYHTYTVDVHTTFLVEELRRLWRGKYERALGGLTELMRGVSDRVVLFLGCLLHDAGKGFGGGEHSQRGVEIARPCLERLGLEPERRERVLFLVAEHLTMSHVAQRRDLTDPRVIVEFARAVGDRENLRNLYLLTFADTRASSHEAWTEWKGRLLRELFERTSEFLETGADDPSRALEQLEAEMEARRREAERELRGLGVAEARIGGYFELMPRRYFGAHSAQEIARHARLVLSYRPERRLAVAVRELEEGVTECLVCTRDVHGLYAKVAGTITSRGLNILASSVYTMRGGLALEVYRITTPAGGKAERQLAWKEFEQALEDVLAGRRDVAEAIRRRRRPVGLPHPPGGQAPSVRITNDESDFHTIVDVTANDRLGLLYDLTRTIAGLGLEIYVSKATTVLDQVADTFYLKDEAQKKITDPERVARLEQALQAVVAEEPRG